jgi:hypothetical protein
VARMPRQSGVALQTDSGEARNAPKSETLQCPEWDRRLEAHLLDSQHLADQVLEMTYITTDVNTVFGIYDTAVLVEKAVDALAGNGFPCNRIFVLHPKNEDTREFAQRKKTQVPAGIDAGPAAGLPLDGTGGFLEMSKEPRQGALPVALRDMGVPADWSDNRVVEGKFLISVKCDTWDAFFRAIGILRYTAAADLFWALSPENYRTASH